MTPPFRRTPFAAYAAFAILLGLSGVVAALFPAMAALEQNVGLAWLFQWRGPIAARSDVVIIAIDQESATRLQLPPKPSQWPRQIHAQLIRQLTDAGAAVIVFDLLFDTPSPVPQQDEALASAMQAAGNVVLTESLEQQQIALTDSAQARIGAVSIEKSTVPIALLARSAIGTAPFPLPKNSRVDAAWFFKSGAGSIPMLPTLALQVQALDAYAPLRRLLQQRDPEFVQLLPIDRSVLLRLDAIEKLTQQLRDYFVDAPARTHDLQRAIASDTAIIPWQKTLLHTLLDVYQGPEARYLNWYGPPRSITTVPYHLALQRGGALRDSFEGKAIFIGYLSALPSGQDRIRDDYDTVFSQDDGVRLSGVEIGATAFSNALDQNFLTPLDGLTRAAILLLWGSLLILVLVHRAGRAAYSVPALLLLAALYAATTRQLFVHYFLWLPLMTPLVVQLPLALLGGTLLRYLAAKKEKLYLQRTFGHFVPPQMVERLASDAAMLGAVAPISNGVCLATDAANYTRLAESMEPVALTELMNRYYATLFAPVAAYGGVVSDIKGDAMLAIWTDHADDQTLRRQACYAAHQLHSVVTQALQDANTPRLPTRIGLAYGPITVGNVGAGQHYEYRAVGDTVNTASRIEGLNKHLGTWVLASADVVDGLGEFLLRPLGAFLVPGKSRPIEVVEIVACITDANPAQSLQRQTTLCRDFSVALALFRQQQWVLAEAAFAAILRDTPDDGPSRFYSRECVRKRTGNPSEHCHPVIRITEK